MISKASAQTLNRWHNFMSVLAGFLVVAGIGGAFAPIWDPDRKLKKDWLVVDQLWDGAAIRHNTSEGIFLATVAPLFTMWISCLNVASTVADDAVVEVIRLIGRLSPEKEHESDVENAANEEAAVHRAAST